MKLPRRPPLHELDEADAFELSEEVVEALRVSLPDVIWTLQHLPQSSRLGHSRFPSLGLFDSWTATSGQQYRQGSQISISSSAKRLK